VHRASRTLTGAGSGRDLALLERRGGWGTILLVWSLVVVTMDNVLRPVLIKRSADLPLLLIFAGVIGALLAFGLVGIFVGPVVLAVAYTLFKAWDQDRSTEA
jgi:predicted PurR-regulated permease PerM